MNSVFHALSAFVAILLATAFLASGAPMTLVATHPTSPLTTYPSIHSIKAWNGRVYFGYGNYNDYPVIVIASYSEADNVMRLEHSASSDAVDVMRVIDGKFFAPSVDPIHYEDFRDFSYYTPGLGWRDMAPAGAYHVFDAAAQGSDLFISGARDIAEGVGTGGAALLRSTDGGRSWALVSASTISRYYWCFSLGSRVWTQGGYFEGGVFTASSVLNYTYLYKAQQVAAGLAVALNGRAPTGSGTSGTLVSFDGTVVRTLATGVLDFTWTGTELFVLTSTAISKATALSATGMTLVNTGLNPPGVPTAIEVLNGTAFAASGSAIYAGRLSGAAWGLGTPPVVNELPDSFGRGLAFYGDRLVVGAPDTSTAAAPLSGQATVWTVPAPYSGAWIKSATVNPPAPDFSGWFGKDAATRDDLMAIVESGFDTVNYDRGSAARVHVYQLVSGVWTSRAILSVPFAHSAVFDENMLIVGTGNPAANQASGLPGVNTYLITRDALNVPAFTLQPQLTPVSSSYGYKPIARVARVENRLVTGWAGDPSRNGGRGLVSVWNKNAAGTGWVATPAQEMTATGVDRYDRFGFAVAAEGLRLAVGAPRDDTAAPQAGRVYLYSWNGTAYVQTQVINSPVAQAEAGFGSAIAMKGNKMLVGAPGVTVGGVPHVGAVYLYRFDGLAWQLLRTLPVPAASQSEFGIEVAIGDAWLAAGSRFAAANSSIAARITLQSVYSITDWYFSNSLIGAAASPAADPDFDGLPNFLEFACGLNPRTSDARPYAAGGASGLPLVEPDLASADGSLLITYLRPAADSLVTAVVEGGPSPAFLAPVAVDTVSTQVQMGMLITTVRVHPPSATESFFLRVRYSYPF